MPNKMFFSVLCIRIRFGFVFSLAIRGRDPYWDCGFGSISRSKEIYQKLTKEPDFQPCYMAFVPA
jgi:hypothetical protein